MPIIKSGRRTERYLTSEGCTCNTGACISPNVQKTISSSTSTSAARTFLHRFVPVQVLGFLLDSFFPRVRWICRGGQLTAFQDAASRTPREECPAAPGQAGRPGPDAGPLHGAVTEPHQPVGVLRGPRHLLPLHELLRRG